MNLPIVRRLWTGALGALLCASAAAPSLAADPLAPGVSCIASAQNRSTPLRDGSDYVLENLPGNGIAPFGVGAVGQPFRVRVTCDDGTVGETPLTFPAFEQQLITPDPIVWGLKTPVPASIRLEFNRATISPGITLQGLVTARYPDATEKIATTRATGTGYRSSSAGFVGVGEDGKVFVQSSATLETFASIMPIPSFVTITAENDGVTASRLIKLVGSAEIKGRVSQVDGKSAANLEVRLRVSGYEDVVASTDATGAYRFNELPLAASRSAQVTVIDRANRRAAVLPFTLDGSGNAPAQQVQLGAAGLVRVKVVDASGAPQPGVEVGVSDIYARTVQGGGLPTQRTDTSGEAYFENVLAGDVYALGGVSGYASEPGMGRLLPNGFVPFVLRGGVAGGAANGSAIVGSVMQQPGNGAAVGASIELTRDGLDTPARQIVDGSGSFAFRGLSPQTNYQLTLKFGTETVKQLTISTGAAASERRYDFSLPQQLGMAGLVVASDGSTLVAGASLQASYYDEGLSTWVPAATATSRADGGFSWRYLAARAYRVEAMTSNGASGRIDVDLRAQPAGTLQNVRLQLTDKVIQTRLGLQATVMGAANYGQLNAQLFVKNTRCPTGCLLGTLAFAGQRLETELLPQGGNDFELRWNGRVLTFGLEVNASTDGQTVERIVDFGPEASGVNRILQQRSLFSFDAVAGDAIDATVLGVALSGQPAARAVKLQLYGPDGEKLAEGQGYDPAQNGTPAAGALRAVAARASGRHTLVVSPLVADATNLGGYGLQVSVAGAPVSVQGWVAGGPARFGAQLVGHVLKRDGAPAADTAVVVSAGNAEKIQLVELVMTDAEGAYVHLNVPLGALEARVADGGGLVLARAKSQAAADGDRVELDLQMAARTEVALTLRLSQALLNDGPIGTVPVEFTDDLNQRRVDLVFEPAATTASVETAVAGDLATAKLVHPRNALLLAQREITGEDGSRVEFEIAMPTGALGGRIVSGTGQVMAGLQVSAVDTDGKEIGQATSSGDGVYAFKVLPADVSVALQTRDVALEVDALGAALVREGVQVAADDLVLPTATVEGKVMWTNGLPVTGVSVEASFGAASSLQASTDVAGLYTFPRVPADRVVTVKATHPATGQQVSADVAGAVGEYAQAPEIVFEIVGATLQGRVRNVSGRALAGVGIVVSDNGARADCTSSDVLFAGRTAQTARSVATAGSNNFSSYATTDAQGRFVITNVPEGPMVVSVAIGLVCQVVERTVDVGASGSAQTMDDIVLADMGSMLLRVVDPAGQPFDVPSRYGNECAPELRLSGPGLAQTSTSLPPSQGIRYEGVPFGRYTGELWECSTRMGQGEVEVRDQAPVNFDITISLLKGVVTYPDGSPVTYGSVSLVQRDAEGNRSESYAEIGRPLMDGQAMEPNGYILYGNFGLGDYEIWARDSDTGIQRRWVGTFEKLPSEPRNLVLPVTAQLQGCVAQSDGRRAAATRVRAFSQGLASGSAVTGSREVQATSGCYNFDRLPAGDTVLHVFEGELLKAVDSFTLAPATDKALVQRNPQYPVTSRALVLAINQQGQPLWNRRMLMQPQQVEQALSYNQPEALSAANGYATFTLLPGPYTATQSDTSWANRVLGRTSMRLGAGATVEASVPYDNSYKFIGSTQDAPAVPDGAAGFMFNEAGQLISAGQVGSFSSWTGPQLVINGMPMPRSMGMDYTVGRREMTLGPFEQGDRLLISRRLYVPETGGYARELETLTNGSARTVTVRVEIVAWTDSYCAPYQITQPQNDAARGYVGYQSCEGSGAHVYNGVGAGAGSLAASRVDLRSEYGQLTQWVLTLAPGQTAALMHFHVLSASSDAAAQADALARLADPSMLIGLTAEDRNNVRNFNIAQ